MRKASSKTKPYFTKIIFACPNWRPYNYQKCFPPLFNFLALFFALSCSRTREAKENNFLKAKFFHFIVKKKKQKDIIIKINCVLLLLIVVVKNGSECRWKAKFFLNDINTEITLYLLILPPISLAQCRNSYCSHRLPLKF